MPDPTTLALLALAALAAGFVDAVVGGGGLIQLPALVLGLTGASPVQVLATNKLILPEVTHVFTEMFAGRDLTPIPTPAEFAARRAEAAANS